MGNGRPQETVKPFTKALEFKEFVYNDEMNEEIIDFLRGRVNSKANKAKDDQNKSKKRGGSYGGGALANKNEEILKKDYTYDHEGNILEVKIVKTDYLPHLASQQVRTILTEGVDKKAEKRLQNKKPLKQKNEDLNPQTEALQKEFNKELEKMFQKENQKVFVSQDVMNVSEGVKPTYGVNLKEGREINLTGPEYKLKLPNQSLKMSLREYKEKYENHDILHRGLLQA